MKKHWLLLIASMLLTSDALAWSWSGDEAGQKLDQEARHFLTTQNVCGVRLKTSYLLDLDRRITKHHKGWEEYERYLIDSVASSNAEYVRSHSKQEVQAECASRIGEARGKAILDEGAPDPKPQKRGKFDVNSWVGIWAADPKWCKFADQIGEHDPAPVRIDPSKLVGLENSCRITAQRLSASPDKWQLTETCEGEGETSTEKKTVTIAADFGSMSMAGRDRTIRFVRCR